MNETGVEGPSDGLLIQSVGYGDTQALAQLYDRHAPWLFLRLTRRCPDEGLVDEVVQDTFLSVWRGAGRFEHGTVGGWIWTIAARRLTDALRARGARPEDAASIPEAAETTPMQADSPMRASDGDRDHVIVSVGGTSLAMRLPVR